MGGGEGRRRQRGTERTRWAPRECGPRSVCKAEARGVLSRFLLWTRHRQSLDHSVLQGNQPVLLVGGSPGLPACTVRPYVACLPGLQFMGKTITKQNLFGFTPPALLDPRAYSSDSLGEPPGSQHLWCALFLPPPPVPAPGPSLLWLGASPVSADIKGPQGCSSESSHAWADSATSCPLEAAGGVLCPQGPRSRALALTRRFSRSPGTGEPE